MKKKIKTFAATIVFGSIAVLAPPVTADGLERFWIGPESGLSGNFDDPFNWLDGEKLDKFALPDAAAADAATAAIAAAERFAVAGIEAKESQRHPPPPFTTSTLQQEASRKLRLAAARTMRLAQELYEGGHITYMRTDGVHIAGEAIGSRSSSLSLSRPAPLPPRPMSGLSPSIASSPSSTASRRP